ncbi:MAG: hypothetical protein HWD85_09355 [Flavobacteriaceae bacterium]|nr:hypothetical protein [Flavobacteriaceae bacterium]
MNTRANLNGWDNTIMSSVADFKLYYEKILNNQKGVAALEFIKNIPSWGVKSFYGNSGSAGGILTVFGIGAYKGYYGTDPVQDAKYRFFGIKIPWLNKLFKPIYIDSPINKNNNNLKPIKTTNEK